MSQQIFEDNIKDLIAAIKSCMKNRLFLPSLILSYSGIDIMA